MAATTVYARDGISAADQFYRPRLVLVPDDEIRGAVTQLLAGLTVESADGAIEIIWIAGDDNEGTIMVHKPAEDHYVEVAIRSVGAHASPLRDRVRFVASATIQHWTLANCRAIPELKKKRRKLTS